MDSTEPSRPTPSLLDQAVVDPYRLLVRNVIDQAIYLIDLEGRIVSCTSGSDEWIGSETAGSVLGQPFATLFSTEDVASGRPARALDTALAHGSHTEQDIRFRKGGSWVWANFTIAPVQERERHVGFVVIVKDISERKSFEAELSRKNEELVEAKRQGGAAREGWVRRLQTMLHNSSDVISIHDKGKMVYQSPSIEHVLGYDENELLGEDLSAYLHPDDLADTEERIARIKSGIGSEPPFLTRFRHKYGEWRWCEFTGTKLDEDPSIGDILFNARDVTDRIRAEQELHFSERRYRTLVQASNKLIWTATPTGEVIPPDETTTYSGRTREASAGRGWLDIVHPEDRERVEREYREAIASGQPLETEARIRRADRAWRRIAARMVPIRDERGTIVEWIGVGEDMTDLRHIERWLRAVLDSTFDAIISLNEQGFIVSANASAHRKFSYSDGELIGQSITALIPDLMSDQHEHRQSGKVVELLLESREVPFGTGSMQQLTGLRRDGTMFPLELVLSEFHLDDSRYITGVIRDISDRERSEQELRLRDRAIRAVSQGILITDPKQPDNPIVFAGGGFERLTGYRDEEIMGRNCRFLQGPKTDRAAVAVMREAIRAGKECSVEILNYRKDGTPFWNALFVTPIRENGEVTLFVGVQADVTERRLLEEQFRQAQKMDAIGQLAGGVAHDFNNLLTIINGCSDLLMMGLGPTDPMRGLLSEIHKAGERAGTLTRQLLLFSRKQVLEPKVLDLNAVVGNSEKMLCRLIGEDVRLATKLDPNLVPVKADPGQIEQVLLNLCVNARDAMPTGGNLTIETKNVTLDEAYSRTHGNVAPGDYTMLAVKDTGTGMDETTKGRLFEPFFTTKGPGKGTGLGLSVVFGVVKQNAGHIEVYTELGRGTTFELYFPQVRDRVAAGKSGLVLPMPRGTETVLLVEDELAVRSLTAHILKRCGYKVIEAADGRQALQIVANLEGPLHLLISDVVMPYMGGRQLAEKVIAARPDVKLLFLSGYTDDAVVRHGIFDAEFAFLQKPFTPNALAVKVRDILDGVGSGTIPARR